MELLALLDPEATPTSNRSSNATTPLRQRKEIDATRLASLRLGLEPPHMADIGDAPSRSPHPHQPVVKYVPIETLVEPEPHPPTAETGTGPSLPMVEDKGIGPTPPLSPLAAVSGGSSSPRSPLVSLSLRSPSPTAVPLPSQQSIPRVSRSPKLPVPPPVAATPLRSSPPRSAPRPVKKDDVSSTITSPLPSQARYLSPTRLNHLLQEQLRKNIERRRVLAAAGRDEHSATLHALSAFFTSTASQKPNEASNPKTATVTLRSVLGRLQQWLQAMRAATATTVAEAHIGHGPTSLSSSTKSIASTASADIVPTVVTHAQGCREHALRELIHSKAISLLVGDVSPSDPNLGEVHRRHDGRLPSYLLQLPVVPYVQTTLEVYRGVQALLRRRDGIRAQAAPWYDGDSVPKQHATTQQEMLSARSSTAGNSSSTSDDESGRISPQGEEVGSTNIKSILKSMVYDWSEVAPPTSDAHGGDPLGTPTNTLATHAPPGIAAFQCYRRLPIGGGGAEEEADAYPCGEYLLCNERFVSSDVDRGVTERVNAPEYHNVVVLGFPVHCPLHLLVASVECDQGIAVAAAFRGPPSFDDGNLLGGMVLLTVAVGVVCRRETKGPDGNDTQIVDSLRMEENGRGNLAGVLAQGMVKVRLPGWCDPATPVLTAGGPSLMPSAWVDCTFLRTNAATANCLGEALVAASLEASTQSVVRGGGKGVPTASTRSLHSLIAERCKEAHVQLLSYPSLVVLEVLRGRSIDEAVKRYPESDSRERVLARQLMPQTISDFLVGVSSSLSRSILEGQVAPIVQRRATLVAESIAMHDAAIQPPQHTSLAFTVLAARKSHNAVHICTAILDEDASHSKRAASFLRSTLRAYLHWHQQPKPHEQEAVSVSPVTSSSNASEKGSVEPDLEAGEGGGTRDSSVEKYVPKKVRWTYSPPRTDIEPAGREVAPETRIVDPSTTPKRAPTPPAPTPSPKDAHSALLREAAGVVFSALGESGGYPSLVDAAQLALLEESTVDEIAYFLYELLNSAETLAGPVVQTCLDNMSSIVTGHVKF